MKTMKQLLRQPVKTAVGIVIVALAFAVLVICVGQYTATDLTRENLDDRYTTIGLLSDSYFWEEIDGGMKRSPILSEGKQIWIDNLKWNYPDIFKGWSSTGLVSAFIPDLTIDNFSPYKEDTYDIAAYNEGYPYRCAMLTVTLTRIGDAVADTIVRRDGGLGTQITSLLYDTTFLCLGKVESVVGLEQGFESPVGKTILLYVTVFDQTEFDALNLQVGQTYLVYGEDYCDQPRRDLVSLKNNNGDKREAWEKFFGDLPREDGVPVYDSWLAQFDCSLTLKDPADMPCYTIVVTESRDRTFVRSEQWRDIYQQDDGPYGFSQTTILAEKYAHYFELPTITPLNGPVDAFLASEEGALWQEALDKMRINNHGFPVLCVDKLGYQAAFARELARIVEGRDFTERELVNGEKVCIISQSVAEKSGVQVGDTIELRTYAYDPNRGDQLTVQLYSSAFPSAALYSEYLGFTSEMESYTIVGFYRQEDAWDNAYDFYGFTPNTIFVPKSSVSAEMITKEKGLYSTLVIENGKLEEFKAVMEEAGLPDIFICYDQGYSEFMASLDAYEEVSQKALYIGLAGFAAVILLFLFLYPAQQKRSLRLMGTLGAPFRARLGHIFGGTLCILIPGAVLGGFAGEKLWHHIAAAMMEWINVEIDLNADMSAVAPKLTAAGIAAVAVLALIVSVAQSRSRGLMKRK